MNVRVKNLSQSLKMDNRKNSQMYDNFDHIMSDNVQQTKSSAAEKFKCKACLLSFTSKGQIDKHRKTKEHKFHEGQMQQLRLQQKTEEQKLREDNIRAFQSGTFELVKKHALAKPSQSTDALEESKD